MAGESWVARSGNERLGSKPSQTTQLGATSSDPSPGGPLELSSVCKSKRVFWAGDVAAETWPVLAEKAAQVRCSSWGPLPPESVTQRVPPGSSDSVLEAWCLPPNGPRVPPQERQFPTRVKSRPGRCCFGLEGGKDLSIGFPAPPPVLAAALTRRRRPRPSCSAAGRDGDARS